MKKLATVIAVLVAACTVTTLSVVHAQTVPRTVLLEEGTNWSCPPCAVMNPLIEAYLNLHPDNIIHLAYHPNWPGADDPMYLNDMTDNMARVVSYYGISGVPNVTFDGGAPFLPNSFAVLDSAFNSRINRGSPVAIHVSRQPIGSDSVAVTVSVVAVGDMTAYKSLRLRVAATESEIDTTGPNKEPRYIHVMRTMMPDNRGTSLSLNKGDTITLTMGYPIKSAYKAAHMYEIAFVQNDATHEVLQTATTLEHFDIAPAAGESAVQRAQAGGNDLTLQIQNTTPESLAFAAQYIPVAGKDWAVTLDGNTSSTQTLSAGAAGPVKLHVIPGSGAYASGYVVVTTINALGDTLTNSYQVKFVAPSTKIAFVDVQSDSIASAHMVTTLNGLNYRYVPLSSDELLSMNGWTSSQFSEIVVEADKWIITGADKQRVSDYLASGGHLLLTGGEIAYGLADPGSAAIDQDPAFLANTLHATYVQDVASTFTVHGIVGDPITDAFATAGVNINGSSLDSPNQPDVITATNGGVPIFYYGTDQTAVAGLRWDNRAAGSTKLVYLSFGLQNLATSSRNAIMTSVMNWFTAQAGVSSPAAENAPALTNYPNPFTSATTIDYTVPASGWVRLEVMDSKGSVIRTIVSGVEQAGTHHVSFTPEGLASGIYFYSLHTPTSSELKAMTIE